MPQIMDSPGVPDAYKPKVRALTDSIGRGTRPNAGKLRDAMLAHRDMSLDDNMLALAPREPEGAGKLKRTTIRGRGQVKQAWDEEPGKFRYHYSPEENFEGIQRRGGLDPDMKKGFSRGVHFMDSPNEYPAIGDRPMNVYRTPVEGKTWGNQSSDDFYTKDFVSQPEVYTEVGGMPRWSSLESAYGVGSNIKGLYDLLSAFMPGRLPQIQTPADWIVQYNMQNLDSSPWNPKNQLGYSVPA